MRIISKYKDYYDYLQGVYGMDDKLILDRRKFQNKSFFNEEKVVLYIAGYILEGFYINENIYYGDALIPFSSTKPIPRWEAGNYEEYRIPVKKYSGDLFINKKLEKDKHKTNEKFNCPILVCDWGGNLKDKNSYNYSSFPQLSKLNVQSIIKPHDMWVMLSSWLSSQIKDPKPNPPQTNKEKILAAGFDLKTSFRNVK